MSGNIICRTQENTKDNMTTKEAIEKGYTNKGEMFGFIPVYVKYDYDCFEAVGTNKFWDFLFEIFTEVDLFLELGYSFNVWIDEEKLKQ